MFVKTTRKKLLDEIGSYAAIALDGRFEDLAMRIFESNNKLPVLLPTNPDRLFICNIVQAQKKYFAVYFYDDDCFYSEVISADYITEIEKLR